MKIDVYSIMHNEEFLVPYWLRHYEKIADRIFIWDDDSTDGTHKLLAKSPKVKFLPIGKKHSDDIYWITKLFPQYEKISKGFADWVIIADADEFIYHPNLRKVLKEEKEKGTEAILCSGYSMVSDRLPTTKKQIYDEIKVGISDFMESKWTVHSPEIYIRYKKGRHGPLFNRRHLLGDRDSGIKLLHFRYMGAEYLDQRNKKLFERHCLMYKIKGAVYNSNERHTMPDRSRNAMLTWFNSNKNKAVNVLKED